MVFNYTAEEGGSLLAPKGWWWTEPTTGFVPIDAPAQLTANNIDNTTPHGHYNALSDEQKAFVLASKTEQVKFQGGKSNTFYFKPMHEVFYNHKLTPPGLEQKFQFSIHPPSYYLNAVGVEGKALHKDDFNMKFFMCVVMVDPPLYKHDCDRSSQKTSKREKGHHP